MAAAQLVVQLGHRLREENSLRVRQPLAELQFATADVTTGDAILQLADVVSDELNIESITRQENLDSLVGYSYRPNLRTLGPKYGKLLGILRSQLPELGDEVLGPLRRGESLTVQIDGHDIALDPDDVLISTEQAEDWVCSDQAGIQIAIHRVLTEPLIAKGMSRDFVRHVNQLRKDAGLQMQDRIQISYASDSKRMESMIAEYGDYIRGETLADHLAASTSPAADLTAVKVGEESVFIWISAQV